MTLDSVLIQITFGQLNIKAAVEKRFQMAPVRSKSLFCI